MLSNLHTDSKFLWMEHTNVCKLGWLFKKKICKYMSTEFCHCSHWSRIARSLIFTQIIFLLFRMSRQETVGPNSCQPSVFVMQSSMCPSYVNTPIIDRTLELHRWIRRRRLWSPRSSESNTCTDSQDAPLGTCPQCTAALTGTQTSSIQL